MRAHNPTGGEVLELIERPGVVTLLMTMHGRDEPVTVAQLRTEDTVGPCVTQILRALAIAGFIQCAGSLDQDELGPVSLTAAGRGLANTLLKVDQWSRTRLASPATPTGPDSRPTIKPHKPRNAH
jgi:hypothetical protein